MKTFTQTSDEPYDRHHYKIVYVNGQSSTFTNYYDLMQQWFASPEAFTDYVEVLDIKKEVKGFK